MKLAIAILLVTISIAHSQEVTFASFESNSEAEMEYDLQQANGILFANPSTEYSRAQKLKKLSTLKAELKSKLAAVATLEDKIFWLEEELAGPISYYDVNEFHYQLELTCSGDKCSIQKLEQKLGNIPSLHKPGNVHIEIEVGDISYKYYTNVVPFNISNISQRHTQSDTRSVSVLIPKQMRNGSVNIGLSAIGLSDIVVDLSDVQVSEEQP